MGGIVDLITDFIKDILTSWVTSNLTNMFTDVNDKVGQVAVEVGKTPSTWNPSIFTMVRNISDSVMVPIAGMIISAILCYELISMIMDKNNMHDFDTSLFIRYLGKACIAVVLLSKTFDITMAIFDVGNHIVINAAGAINATATIDVEATLLTMFTNQLNSMSLGELFGLGLETMIVSFGMKIMSAVITVIIFGRMIEIYLYISVAPVPFSTLGNREWGSIGTNYIKALVALAFQGFFLMVCVGIYSALVASLSIAGNIHSALWSIVAYTVVLCFSMGKTGSLSRSIMHAH
ncbi:MAG: CD0415/CD1112 family protein [Lachnospiraceae bacterium]|nr:CD0415/CD1112 family protein [Lachnospiraceae bacterium]